jgi:membrane protein DedA with SNARE-associated domain
MSDMRYRRFLVANAAGGLCWGLGYSLLGYFAGNGYRRVAHYSSFGAIGVVGVIIVFGVVMHLRRRRRERREEVSEPPPPQSSPS